MDKRRFFLLKERCPEYMIPQMMGRMVAHRTIPLLKIAPSVRVRSVKPTEPAESKEPKPIEPTELTDSIEPTAAMNPIESTESLEPLEAIEPIELSVRHSPENIIKNILPEPQLSQNIIDLLNATTDDGLKLSLGELFGVDVSRSNNDTVELETNQIKTHALTNPDDIFDELMDNEDYAKDILKFFKSLKKRHAYFVTGFLTASKLTTTRTSGKDSKNGFKIKFPLGQFVAGPAGAPLDLGVNPSHNIKGEVKRKMEVVEEEIFAISYSLVKFRFRVRKSDVTKNDIYISGPRFAKKTEIAFRPDDAVKSEQKDDDGDAFLGTMDENESSDEEDGAGKMLQTLHITIHAKKGSPSPKNPSRWHWQVTISTENSAVTSTKDLFDPFSIQQKTDCRWYIETFARKEPYSLGRAGRFEDSLNDYAASLFRDLQLVDFIPAELKRASPGSGPTLSVLLSIYDEESKENSAHRLHWELLENAAVWELDIEVTVRRMITPRVGVKRLGEAPVISLDQSNRPMINGLLVTARNLSQDTPMYNDISPHLALGILSRFQDDLIKQKLGTLTLDIVRPGSLEALDKQLKKTMEAHPTTESYYHFIHFDLHGIVTEPPPSDGVIDNSNLTDPDHSRNPSKMAAYLLFNDSHPDQLQTKEESADKVGKILQKYGIRIAVLNACESAREDVGTSANLARTFTNSGVENVLAMSFSVNRSAAKIFLRAFYYGLLLKGLSFSRAASVGREVLRLQPERDARMGLKRKVFDYFVPVVYSAREMDSHFVVLSDKMKMSTIGPQSSAFALGVLDSNSPNELPFIGREFDLLRLEKKLVAEGRVYLFGQPGVGKTSFLRYASKLWIQTSFVDKVVFLDFTRIKNLADAVSQLVSQLPGTAVLRKNIRSKLAAFVQSSSLDSGNFSDEFSNAYPSTRFVFIFDGLHEFFPTTLEESMGDILKDTPKELSDSLLCLLKDSIGKLYKPVNCHLVRFLQALIKLRNPKRTQNTIYEILSSRSRDGSTLPFEESFRKDVTEAQLRLGTLDLTDSIELSQILIQNSGLKLEQLMEDSSKELTLLIMLLDENPAAIVHVVPQLAELPLRSRSVSELRAIIHRGIPFGSYSMKGDYGNGIFEQIDDAYRILNDEQRAFIILFSAFWSEATSQMKFVEWVTTTSKMCNIALNSLALPYFMAKGFLECDNRMSGDDGESTDPVITWIHPLLTLYGRRAAYDRIPKTHVQLSQKVEPSGLQTRQSIFSSVCNFLGPFDISKVRCQTIAALTLLSILDLEVKFDQIPEQFSILSVNFRKIFLDWVSGSDLARLTSTIARGFNYNDLHRFWASEAANLATCLSMCIRTSNGKPYIPVKNWPLEYFCFHVANIRLVGNSRQVAELAAYFEKILDILLDQTKEEPFSPTRRNMLIIANSLAAIFANEVMNLTKRKEYLDIALKIGNAADSKSPDILYLKAMTLRYQALYHLTTKDAKKAMEAWQKMQEMEEALFDNNMREQPILGTHLSPEQTEEVRRMLSTTEGTTEEVSHRLMSLASGGILEAFFKSRQQTGKLFKVVARGEYDKMRPRNKTGLFREIEGGLVGVSNAAEKSGWHHISADRRWWPEDFDLRAFIDKFDNANGRLDALEEAMDIGNTAQASDHLIALMMRAHEHLELDDLEEYVNAFEELARNGVVPELADIDWKQLKIILRSAKAPIGLLSGKGTRKNVGKGKSTLASTAESFEDQIEMLKQQGGPPDMIAGLEATVNASRASRLAAKAKLENSVRADENFLAILKEKILPQKYINGVETSIREMRADQDKLDIQQGITAESADTLQNFSTALRKTIIADPDQLARLQESNLQLQQLVRDLDEAEVSGMHDLALTRLDVLEEFVNKPENEVFKEGYNKDAFKNKRASLLSLKTAEPIMEDVMELLSHGRVDEARDLTQAFRNSLPNSKGKGG